MEEGSNSTRRDRTSRESIGPLLEAFIASYRTAFESGNVDEIRRHFADRVCVASDTGAAVRLEVLSDTDLGGVIEQLVSQYRALGVAKVETREVETRRITDRLGLVLVRWSLLDDGLAAVYDFSAVYTVACDGRSCRIVSIAHDEVAQARRLRGEGGGAR